MQNRKVNLMVAVEPCRAIGFILYGSGTAVPDIRKSYLTGLMVPSREPWPN